ncbi:helix-turn-helix domain-containing protein [Lactobacillus sp. AN1001]
MGNRLRQLREEKEMTLKELVSDLEKKTGLSISPDTLAKYEQGNREPKLERWQQLADYFDVSVGYLQGVVDNDKEKKIIDEYISDLIDCLDALSKSLVNVEPQKGYQYFSYRDKQLILVGVEFAKRFTKFAKNNKLLQSGKFTEEEFKKYLYNQIRHVIETEVNTKELTEKYKMPKNEIDKLIHPSIPDKKD